MGRVRSREANLLSLIVLLVLLLLVACSGAGGGSGAGVATTSPPSGGTGDGKPTPPVEVSLVLDGGRIVPGTPFTATVVWTPLVDAPAARTRVEATGTATVTGQGGTGEWKDVAAGRKVTVPVQLTVRGDGAGEVRTTVEVLDGGGTVQFGRTSVLYVLATGSDVLTGTTGVLELRLRQLDADRSAGRVTAEEYTRQRDRILGGGATETRN